MSLHNRLCELLGCRFPILQAGMGGVARAPLAAAVSDAGGYGCLGMVRESPSLIVSEIARVRELTDKPFAVNLIPAATDPTLFSEELDAWPETLCAGGSAIYGPLGEELGAPLWNEEGIVYADLDLRALARSKFAFDDPGHYARPDVFRLSVDESPHPPVGGTG